MKELWNKIIEITSEEGMEIKVFTIRNVKETYFRVYKKDDYLLVNKSIDHENTCNINIPRTINYKQFEDVYAYYDRYVIKEKGIREKLAQINNNTTYILSLINYFRKL